jgi:DNA (cytosine-5)-methyltransferase 1
VRCADLFAGWGGFTAGASRAGAQVVWAANHWELAVTAHAENHPETIHVCQDLRQADWTALPEYDWLLASPSCPPYSQASQPARARGSKLTKRHHDGQRATAWAVIDCADTTEPTGILVENIPQFRRWRLYPVWRAALESLGYSLTEKVVVATRFGVPQRRERLFICGHRGRPLSLTVPELVGAEPSFGPCVQWQSGRWRPIESARGVNARARLRAASRRYGRALVQHVTGHKGIPLTEPIRTITTQDQWQVVRDDQYRPLTIRETARGMGFEDSYRWPDQARRRDTITGLGNAVPPPVAAHLIRQILEATQ